MIVAMIAVRVMQVAVDQIVDMVTVRDGFMAAAGPVLVTLRMAAASMLRRARVGILGADIEDVFVEVVAVRVMQVTVVEIIHVVAVLHGDVSAARPVSVRVVVVNLVIGHDCSPF